MSGNETGPKAAEKQTKAAAAPAEGTFAWAVAQVKQGRNVHRPQTARKGNVVVAKGMGAVFGADPANTGTPTLPVMFTVSIADIEATDWKVA